MARNEIVVDLTNSKKFEVNIDRSGNICGLGLETENTKVELVVDAEQYDLLLDAMLRVAPRKRQGVA